MQRTYIEFQRFTEQASLTSPHSESCLELRQSAMTHLDIAIIPALPLASTSAMTDAEGVSVPAHAQ